MKESMHDLYVRAYRAGLLMIFVFAVGTFGFYLLGSGQWSFEDCLYMTAITLSTVGYGEIVPISEVPHASIFVVALILFGMGVTLYFASSIVAIFVEGDIKNFWRRRKMKKAIDKLENHIVVCGAGTTGGLVVDELIATQTPFVVVEQDEEKILERVSKIGREDLYYLVGDATDPGTLRDAHVDSAQGLIIALPEDKDCLIVALTARGLNPDLRIVSRAHEPEYVPRIQKAGADKVISPNAIGGMRLVSEMIRPTVVEFLDLMLRDKEKNLRIEQVQIASGSEVIGKKLKETEIRKVTDLLVIAARNEHTGTYTYNPGPDFVVEDGTVLVVLGETNDVIKLREMCGHENAGAA